MYVQETVRHYAHIVSSYWLIILVGVIVGSTITFTVSLFLPPVYQANSLVQVNSTPATTTTATPGNDVFSAQAQAVSYALLVTDPQVLQQAARKLAETGAGPMKGNISASPVDNTQLIEIRVSAADSQRAADIANAMATAFVQFQEKQERNRLQTVLDSLTESLSLAKTDVDLDQQQLSALQNAAARQDKLAQQESSLAAAQSTYDTLLSSYGQLQAQKQQALNMLSVVQLAIAPGKPTGSSIVLNTILAACLSFVLMMTILLMHDWLDITIKTEEDVMQLAGLEPLGSILRGTATTRLFDLRAEYQDEVKEAFQLLGIRFGVLWWGQRSILVTSPRAKTGTTATATYLALSLAQQGMRILLIDANTRRPSLHNVFLHPNNHGLADSLHTLYPFQSSPQPLPPGWLDQWQTQIPNLWLLPTGPVEAYPNFILSQQELRLFTSHLLGQSADAPERLVDLIIFDTAALDDGNDVYQLAPIVDATVLIIEAGKMDKKKLQELRFKFKRLGMPIFGVVVNRQRKRYKSYFYSSREEIVKSAEADFPRDLRSAIQREDFPRDEAPTIGLSMPHASGTDELKKENGEQMPFPLSPALASFSFAPPDEGWGALPETPLPLPLLQQESLPETSMLPVIPADEKSEEPGGKLQFGPLLRLNQERNNNKSSES